MSRGTGSRAWSRRGVPLPFALILLVGTVAGCTASGSQPAAQSTATTVPPELAKFCGEAIDLVQVLQDGPDIGSEATPEAVATGLQEFQARFEPPLVAVEGDMPDLVRQDVGTLGRQARFAVAMTTEAPLETPEYESALDRTRINVAEQCGLTEVRVAATEFTYDGMATEVPARPIVLTLIALGAEPHDINVFRIDEDDRRPFKELITLPEAQWGLVLTSVDSRPNADPGDTDTRIVKLTPGRYGIACLIPQGSTSAQDGTGPSHASLGETAEFTVR